VQLPHIFNGFLNYNLYFFYTKREHVEISYAVILGVIVTLS
jgi:hypothetical protein